MPIVPAKCPNCAANLEVNSSQDAAICTHCGTPFIVEKAITNYQISNQISANVVNVYGSFNSDFEIVSGVLTKYKGTSPNVVIPNNVSVIGEFAFNSTRITSVVIPDSVIEIGQNAFGNCPNLRNVSLPISLKIIGQGAFASSGLEYVNIPSSVELVSGSAFSHCKNLKSIKIDSAVIDVSAFQYCENLNNVELQNHVRIIAYKAFANCCKLNKITLPESLSVINCSAFSSCDSLTIIWPNRFKNKQVTKFLTAIDMISNARYRITTLDTGRYKFKNEGLDQPLLYIGKKIYDNASYELLFRNDLDRFIKMQITTEQSKSDEYNFLMSTETKYKELSEFLIRAGIEKSVIKKVPIPIYKENFFGGKKQVNSYEALQIQLVEEGEIGHIPNN